MDDVPELPPAEGDARTKNLGKWLTGSGVMIACLLVVVGMLGLTVIRQVHVIDALVVGVTQQRDQFTACKNKPATAPGCTTPVAAEPSVIVKQGSRGPAGLSGAVGAVGPQGPQGPQGPVGPIGKTGPPPGCALLSTACVGVAGPAGPAGPAGKDGKDGGQGPAGADGKDGGQGPAGPAGADGKNGADGAPGMQGAQGVQGYSVTDMDCVGDDAASHWVIYLSSGEKIDATGPCRVGPALP